MSRQVLVVDDDAAIQQLLRVLLAQAGYHTLAAGTAAEALDRLRRGFEGVVILDVQLPDRSGPELFEDVRRVAPDCPVVFLTGNATADLALSTICDGAFEFIDKAQLTERLVPTVKEAAAVAGAASDTTDPFQGIVGNSPAMRAVQHSLKAAIESNVVVLVRGESGTGKELIARALHDGGPRRNGPFVAVNCAGIPDNLLEAELFGYERGAFTGAVGRKPGRIDLAQRGTLFLDEIGDMPASLQAKLLRVLQEGEYQRLGGTETLKADVRFVSATNRPLEEDVQSGRFREDLYYRLAVYTVELPPLRERTGDLSLLVDHFVRKLSRSQNRRVRHVDPMALELLGRYSFPGNVRQLENAVAHAVVACRGDTITVADLPKTLLRQVAMERQGGESAGATPTVSTPTTFSAATFPTLAELERTHISAALDLAKGNKTRAASLLGVSRMTLYRKLQEMQAEA